MAVTQHRRVYCKNSPCDYEGIIFDDGSPVNYEDSIATCPECGFKTLYHIEVKALAQYAKALEDGEINISIDDLLRSFL